MKRVIIIAGSVAVTAATLAAALVIGTWGFEHRQVSFHQTRLARLLDREPTLERVDLGLADEGTHLVASASRPDELRRLAARWGGSQPDQVLEKGERWPEARAYRAGDFVYILYFDAAHVLRDYSLHKAAAAEADEP